MPGYPGQIHANIGPIKTNVTFDHKDCGVTLLKNDHVLINLLLDTVTKRRRAANIRPKIPFTFSYTKETRELVTPTRQLCVDLCIILGRESPSVHSHGWMLSVRSHEEVKMRLTCFGSCFQGTIVSLSADEGVIKSDQHGELPFDLNENFSDTEFTADDVHQEVEFTVSQVSQTHQTGSDLSWKMT